MLILIAGLTGTLGQHLTKTALSQGHTVRGFGRSRTKLHFELLQQLESFTQCEHYDDRVALDKAVAGVDAVICSYVSHAEAILEAQLALLRATERAGVKIYHAHSWNADWRKIKFEDWEHYDAYIAFRRQVELTSTVKPVYVFTGIFGEYAMSEPVGVAWIKHQDGVKTLRYWGDGTAKWDFTYIEDAARFSIDLITTNNEVLAGKGGFFSVRSGEASAMDIAQTSEAVKGEKLKLQSLGSVEDLMDIYRRARDTEDQRGYFAYANFYSQAANILGIWKLDDPEEGRGRKAIEHLFDVATELPADYQ